MEKNIIFGLTEVKIGRTTWVILSKFKSLNGSTYYVGARQLEEGLTKHTILHIDEEGKWYRSI